MNPAGLAAQLRRHAEQHEIETAHTAIQGMAAVEANALRARADELNGGRPFRLLVTGSRQYTDHLYLRAELDWFADFATSQGATELIVVHGACYPAPQRGTGVRPAKSADWLAHLWATVLPHPLPVRDEPHPAAWAAPCRPTCKHGARPARRRHSICPAAGNYRNEAMVARGADAAAVFQVNNSPGTRDCLKWIRAAGIPTPRLNPSPAVTLPQEASRG